MMSYCKDGEAYRTELTQLIQEGVIPLDSAIRKHFLESIGQMEEARLKDILERIGEAQRRRSDLSQVLFR